MAKFGGSSDLVKCSFCGKSQSQVKRMIAGPGVYICDECIDLCNEIIEEELGGPEKGTEQTITRPGPVPGAGRPHGPGATSPSGPDAGPVQAHTGRFAGNYQSQAGQALPDLLLVGATSANCPMALLAVASADGWETLAFGAEREALEDPELYDIIAGRKDPVEVTDPAGNPALATSRLARSALGIRWLCGVPVLGPTGEVGAIFAVLDTEPRELSRRQRQAVEAIGRLIRVVLLAPRATDQASTSATPPDAPPGRRTCS